MAGVGRSVRPPLGGPCLFAFHGNNKPTSIFRITWPSYGGRMLRPILAINMTLLRRGGRNGQTPDPAVIALLSWRRQEDLEKKLSEYLRGFISVLRSSV